MNRASITFIIALAMLLSGSGIARMAHVAVHHSSPQHEAMADAEVRCHVTCCGHRQGAAAPPPAAPADDEGEISAAETEDDFTPPAVPCHPDDCQTCQMLATKSAIAPAWLTPITSIGPVRYEASSVVAVLVGCLRPAASVPRAPPF